MNYIQVKDFGGKDRGLKFNMAAVDEYWRNLVFGSAAASNIYVTFYSGLIGNCVVKSEQIDFTLEDVSEWVDTLYANKKQDIIKDVCEMFAETETYKIALAEKMDQIRALQTDEKKTVKKKKA